MNGSLIRRFTLLALFTTLTCVSLSPRAQPQKINSYLCFIAFGEDVQLTKKLIELSCAANSFGNQQAAQELDRLQIPSRDFVRAKPNQSLSFFLGVINGTSQTTLTLLMLNYGLQRPFVLEGKEDIVHRLSVPRDDGALQAHVFQYEIPPLPSGLNNISLVLIGVHETPPIPRTVTLYVEMSIQVGNGEPPKVSPLRPPDSVFRRGTMLPSDSNLRDGIFLSLVPNPLDQQIDNWQVELLPGQRLDYYLVVRAPCIPGGGDRDYIAMSILDGLQLPIEVGNQQPLAHLRLSCDQEADIPASLIAPQEPGSHLLVPFGIINPYNLRSEANPLEGPLSLALITPLYTIIVKPSTPSN